MERADATDPRPQRDVGSGATPRRLRRDHRRGRPGRTPVVLLLLTVLLAACGSVDELTQRADLDEGWVGADDAADEPASEPAPEAEMDVDTVEEEAADEVQDDAGAGDLGAEARRDQQAGRAVIRTAHMHIRARDTATTADEVVALVEGAEGYVSGTDLARDADGVVSGRLTLRVPTEELTTTLDAIDELADSVLERRLDEQDVTTELSDLDARITNLEAYEEELRQLLTEVREATTDTEDLLRVFDRVNDVRAEIDQATARRTVLSDQVAMSTIHLQLSPTPATGPVTDPAWAPGDTARGALAATMRILTGLADAVIRIGLTVLPVTLVVLVPIALIVWAVRRVVRARRDRTADEGATSRPTDDPPPPPGQPQGAAAGPDPTDGSDPTDGPDATDGPPDPRHS